MSMDAIINLEEALGRKFTEQESARLREIGSSCICGMTTLSGRFWQLWSTKEFFTKPCRTGLLTHHGKSWTVSAQQPPAKQQPHRLA